jgi:hypothetical protein
LWNSLSLEDDDDDDDDSGQEATIWGIVSPFEPVCEWQLQTYLSLFSSYFD